MKYAYTKDIWFEADPGNAREICEAIWHGQKFKIHSSVEEWMKANAKVVRNYTGKPCSSKTFEAHVRDLLRLGILQQAGE